MKFIVFNIVVAGALIYLFANNDNGADVSLPKLDDVTAAAEQLLDRTRAKIRQTQTDLPGQNSANPDSVVPKSEFAAAPPPVAEEPLLDAPVIDEAELAPPASEARVAEAPEADTRQPLEPAVARRRAEVLGEAPGTSFKPVQPTAGRRQQLLDLAEEMEFLAAEFSIR